MQSRIQAAFFDVDGTLFSLKSHRMPASTLFALRALREKGIKTVVATGRPAHAVAFLREIFPFDAYLTANGQICFNCDGVSIHRHSFGREETAAFLGLMRLHPFPCLFVEETRMYINYIDEIVERHCAYTNQPLPPLGDAEDLSKREFFQFCAYIGSATEQLLLRSLPFIQADRSTPDCVDIVPKGGGKDSGMRPVADFYDIPLDRIIAFGDGPNDTGMLRCAGIGVAMGDAQEAVKRSADYVAAAVDDDGILRALEHYRII